LIQREVKVPKGSGGWRRGFSSKLWKLQRVRSIDAAQTGANRIWVAEQKGRTGSGSGELEAKWQARNVDLGMEASKGAAVAGEGKAVTSIRPREGEKAAARLEALNREPAKRFSGSREARRPALLIAMFSTVHAGGEQGWKSDHLEPFPLWWRRR
jgi:hypothetical protein